MAEAARYIVDDELAEAGVWFVQHRLGEGRFARADGPFDTAEAAEARCRELNAAAAR